MAKKSKTAPLKPRSPFTSGLVIYIWVLLILGGIALMVLQDFLKTYEGSQAGYCVENYAQTLRSTVPDAALHALDDLDPLVMSEEDRADFIRSLLREADLKKLPGGSSGLAGEGGRRAAPGHGDFRAGGPDQVQSPRLEPDQQQL